MTITGGTDRAYSAGAIVEITPTARWAKDLYDWGIAQHNQDGTHSAITATSITATSGTFTNLTIAGTASAEGWSPLGATPDTVTANGNRSYDLVFNSNDLTDTLSPGMRVKATRTVAAPTYIANLEASSSHYFNKTSPAGMTFTDDFVVSAWVKLESVGTYMNIASRYNGTSGWQLSVNTSGQIEMTGYNAGAANYSQLKSYQSLPLNKWVHVAAQLDMSAFTATTTTSYVMIDGVNAPATVLRGGTNPTALIQAGNLEIGSANATAYFDGYIAQVAIYSAKVTQANVLATMAQGLTGSETSLVSAYSLNNTLNDLSANANNLTAQNGASAAGDESPFAGGVVGGTGTTEYGIVTAAAFSTNTTLTVQVPEGYALPTTGGISAVSYSINKIPYGFPVDPSKWLVQIIDRADETQSSPSSGTWYNLGGNSISVPIGVWDISYQVLLYVQDTTATDVRVRATISTANNTESDPELTSLVQLTGASATLSTITPAYRQKELALTSATPLYLNVGPTTAGMNSIVTVGAQGPTIIKARFGYL